MQKPKPCLSHELAVVVFFRSNADKNNLCLKAFQVSALFNVIEKVVYLRIESGL